MHHLPCCFQPVAAAASALSAAPFDIPATAFWIYVCASLLFITGFRKILGELPGEHGVDRIMPFGRLFFAIPMAVFGSEHFTATAGMASLVPRWIPAPTFWVYLVGVAFLCAAASMTLLIRARLAAGLVGVTLLIFACIVHTPAVVAHPDNRFYWAPALREVSFSGGAFAFAMGPWMRSRRAVAAVPRLFVGIPSLVFGVENLLHPAYAPGVPLQNLTPAWIPGRMVLSYSVGVVLIVAGVCLLVNRNARLAATSLGLTILLTVFWVYLPMLLRAPTDLPALNFFFDTLLFCGAILLLANATSQPAAVAPT